MTLLPAYGRDYKSAKAVQADWNANKDFIIGDLFHVGSGKPTNKSDLARMGVTETLMVRYDRQLKQVQVKV